MTTAALIASPRPAAAEPMTCADLEGHPAVIAWADALRDDSAQAIDLTTQRLLGLETERDDPREASGSLRIVAIELPGGAPLVEATCALGRALGLERGETLVVIAAVGLHAYSSSLGYRHLRAMARRHYSAARKDPLGAARAYGAEVEDAVDAKERERYALGIIGLTSVLLGCGLLVLLWRRARRSGEASGA